MGPLGVVLVNPAWQALEAFLSIPTLGVSAAQILEPLYEARNEWEALVRAIEVLVAGNCVLHKERQDPAKKLDYKDAFELD